MTIPEEVYDSLTKEIEALEARQNIFHAWPGDEGSKVVSGEFAVDKSIKDGSAWLVIIASDASDKLQKSFPTRVSSMKYSSISTVRKRNLDVQLVEI